VVMFPKFKLKGADWGSFSVFLIVLSLLVVFLLYPVLVVLYEAFTVDGAFSLLNFTNFFANDLFVECFSNSVVVAVAAVVTTSLIGVPLSYFITRYDFPGKRVLEVLAMMPMIIPPFVGAIGLTYFFGKYGIVNLFLTETFPVESIPFLKGPLGILFVETIHLYPLIFLNCSASLAGIDPSLEESAKNLGASGFRLFRSITFPLMLPGYAAGALLVFIWSFSDLGTPLMLQYFNLLAPQAYHRITSFTILDVNGYVMCVLLAAVSLLALFLVRKYVSLRQYTIISSGIPPATLVTKLRGKKLLAVLSFCIAIVLISLTPHLGIFLASLAKVWSMTYLPETYTLDHYDEVLFRTPQFIQNTMVYCSLSAVFDVVLGAVIAYLLVRKTFIGKEVLDALAMLPFAIPGIVIGIGYLRTFYQFEIPGLGVPLTATWFILPLSYMIRRLPYTVRSCFASLQQIHVSLEEASMNLGANRFQTFLRVTLPLMWTGILAGGILAFVNAVVEISTTLFLTPSLEQASLSFGIYQYIYNPRGKGPASALGVFAILLVSISIIVVRKIMGRRMGAIFRA
jgi:iron(III) transport system permease protein